MVDARREAVGGEERPFSRDFSKSLEERWSQKRGGAKGGAPSYIRRTDARLALSPCGSCVSPGLVSCFSSRLLLVSFALVPLLVQASRLRWSPSWFMLLWSSSSCGLACGPVERPVRWRRGPVASPGDARETRTGGAAVLAVWRGLACPCEECRRELADHRGTSRVQVTCYGLVGPSGQPRLML